MWIPLRGNQPVNGNDVYVAEVVEIIGDIPLGEELSNWFHA